MTLKDLLKQIEEEIEAKIVSDEFLTKTGDGKLVIDYFELKYYIILVVKEACQEMARRIELKEIKSIKDRRSYMLTVDEVIGFNRAIKQLKQIIKKFLNL